MFLSLYLQLVLQNTHLILSQQGCRPSAFNCLLFTLLVDCQQKRTFSAKKRVVVQTFARLCMSFDNPLYVYHGISDSYAWIMDNNDFLSTYGNPENL